MWQCGPWTHWMGGWGMVPFGGLFSLLVFAVVIAVAAALFRGATSRSGAARSPALDALEARYAKGEIQREEYLQKKSDLNG
jgi:putative membrane protein